MKTTDEIYDAFVDSKITMDGGGGPEDSLEGTIDGIMLGLWIAGIPDEIRNQVKEMFNAIHSDSFNPTEEDVERFKIIYGIPDEDISFTPDQIIPRA